MATATGSGTPVGTRRFFADLSVNIKILTAVVIGVLVAITVGIVGLRALSTASEAAQVIYSTNLASVKAVGEIDGAMTQARLDLANHAISSGTATKAKYEQAFTAAVQEVDAGFIAYAASDPAGDPAMIASLQSNWQNYVQVAQGKQLPTSRIRAR